MTVPLILWVEDNPEDVELVRQAFVELGVDVEFIVPENAVLAFRYMLAQEPYRLSRRPPSLILVDLNLPILSGDRVVQEVRRYRPWSSIPIVILTSSADPVELGRCRALGATDCLTKPPTFDGYVEIARNLARRLAPPARRAGG